MSEFNITICDMVTYEVVANVDMFGAAMLDGVIGDLYCAFIVA